MNIDDERGDPQWVTQARYVLVTVAVVVTWLSMEESIGVLIAMLAIGLVLAKLLSMFYNRGN